MVRSSGIREKIRSNVLKELARERGVKRPRDARAIEDNRDDEEESTDEEDERKKSIKVSSSTNSLLSILPKPKNSSSFGPTIRIDKLLQIPERDDELRAKPSTEATLEPGQSIGEDGILEVDVSKVVGSFNTDSIKELTVEKSRPVIIAKGKEKQKNQITYLAQLGKATELERKEQAALGRMNKAAARSKYGW